MSLPWRQRLARSGAVLGYAALTLGVLGLSARLHLREPVGRRALAEALSRYASDSIPGELIVEDVTEAALPHICARRIVVRTEESIDVVVLHDVCTDLDVRESLWHGGLILHRGRIGSGHVQIAMSPNRRTWIERAFCPRPPPPWQVSPLQHVSAPGRLQMSIDDIEFRNLDIEVTLPGQRFSLLGAGGRARIWLPDNADVKMQYWSVRGRLRVHGSPLPELAVTDLAIALDPRPPTLMRIATHLHALSSDLTAAVEIPTDGTTQMCLWTGGFSLVSVFAHTAAAVSSTNASMHLSVIEAAPPAHPVCRRHES